MFLGNFRTANSLEHFIRVKLFLKYQQFRLVDSSLREMLTKTDKDRQSTVKVAGFLPRICFSRANKTLGLFSLHAKRYFIYGEVVN